MFPFEKNLNPELGIQHARRKYGGAIGYPIDARGGGKYIEIAGGKSHVSAPWYTAIDGLRVLYAITPLHPHIAST
jgi:hypothetical protein